MSFVINRITSSRKRRLTLTYIISRRVRIMTSTSVYDNSIMLILHRIAFNNFTITFHNLIYVSKSSFITQSKHEK